MAIALTCWRRRMSGCLVVLLLVLRQTFKVRLLPQGRAFGPGQGWLPHNAKRFCCAPRTSCAASDTSWPRSSGSTIGKARFEISYSVDLLRTAAGEVRRLYGDTFPNDNPQRLSMVIREPLGVVAVVSPYNAPLALLCKMAAFPLAAGNAVVIKPSEETPLIALAFGKLLVEAGLPPQAISVIPGYGKECGAALVAHPAVRGIALTGSTATGMAIGAQGMQRMVRMQLERGGKCALLVLRDFDPAKAAAIAAQGMFNHAGQICMANSRVVVEAPLMDAFCADLKN